MKLKSFLKYITLSFKEADLILFLFFNNAIINDRLNLHSVTDPFAQ